MRFDRRARTRWCSALCLCLAGCVFLSCSGCALTGGKKDETASHVFVGDTPVPGTVQVATNKPIAVVSVGQDAGNKAHWELRDCGQFVLMPPHIYRAVRADLELLEKYRQAYGELVGGRTDDAPPEKHFLLYRVPADDGVRAEIVEL